MKKKSIFLILFLLCAIVIKAQDYVEITFNEGLTTLYKLKFTTIGKSNECSVKLSKAPSELTALEIPTQVTINNSNYYVTVIDTMAFENQSKFSSVNLPENLKTIKGRAFYKCTELTGELIIPDDVTYIGNHAFYNCKNLTSLNFEQNSKLKTIGDNAFYNCSSFTGKLTIPSSVISIGNYAFYLCTKFTELSFEENSNLNTIGDYAFAGLYNGSNSDYRMEFTGELIIPNSVTSIGDYAFYLCSKFTSLSFEENSQLKTIGDYAFTGYNNYTSIYMGFTGELIIPDGVTYIGNHAFHNCNGFTGELVIPNGVTSIGNYTFYNCSGFTGELIIYNNITSIGDYAFYRCNKLTSLSFEENSKLKTIGNYAFAGYYNGSSSDYSMELTGELIIPNSVTSIGNHAFHRCSKFTSLSFEENSQLKTIGDYAFDNCNGFTGKLIIPNSVTSIGNNAFYNCKFTGEFTLPNSLTSIGIYAFYNCSFSKVICYLTEPATFTGVKNIFYYTSTSKPKIYVPAVALESYKSKWHQDKAKIYVDGIPTFINNGSIEDANNWYILEDGSRTLRLPNKNDDIAINTTLFIKENEILNVKSLGYCENGDLTIKDGGQLICDTIKNAIKIEKNIEAHSTTENTTWTTISSPFCKNLKPSEITNLTTGDYSLYRYDEPSSTWQNYKNSANNGFAEFEAGRGYLYSNSDNTTLVFRGIADNNNVSYNLTNEAEILTGFHLIGNPYTHNITWDNLVTIKEDILAEGYYSLSNEGAWGVKYGEETEIKPCQGILIKTTEEGVLNINSSVTATRGNAKRNSASNILAISVANKKYSDIAYISFNEGFGLDKIAHENENIPMVYIPGRDADYAIAIKDKDFVEIPVNFEAGSMGEYTIKVSQKDCGFKKLYLYDKVTDKTINILKNEYTFFATSSDAPDRFVLKAVNDEVLDNYAFINNGNLVISNIKGSADIDIFDVLGRKVLQNNCSDDEYQIATDQFSAGVYIIRKSDENGVKTQKIVID